MSPESSKEQTTPVYEFFNFIRIMIPFFIVFFLTIFSFVNKKILNGIVYLFGIFITSGFILLLALVFRLRKHENAKVYCNTLTFPFMSNSISSKYPNPHLNTGILAYSIGYTLLAPIFDLNIKNLIPPLFLFFILHIIYVLSEKENNCSTLFGLISGTLIGISIGIIYYFIVKFNNKKLLYNSDSETDYCGYTNNPDMVCEVYKGEEMTDIMKISDSELINILQ